MPGRPFLSASANDDSRPRRTDFADRHNRNVGGEHRLVCQCLHLPVAKGAFGLRSEAIVLSLLQGADSRFGQYSGRELALAWRTLPTLPFGHPGILFSDRTLFRPWRGARLREVRLRCSGLLYGPVWAPLYSLAVDFRPIRCSTRFCFFPGTCDIRPPGSPERQPGDGLSA